MTKNNELLNRWMPSILMMLIISFFSATPGKTINDLGLGNESLHISGHSLMFFLLCFTYYKGTKNIFYSILLTALFGFSDEYHQSFTLGRSSTLFDVATDTIGGIFAGILLWKLQFILPKKLKNWLNK